MPTIIVAILIVASLGFAADPPKLPTIPAEIQTEIALTQLDAQLAHEANDKAQATAQAALAKGQAACGDKFNLQRTGTALSCVAKPEAPKPAEGKK